MYGSTDPWYMIFLGHSASPFRHYYGLWSPPRFLGYLYAHFGYLHRLFCKLGVKGVNTKVFTLFTPFTLNVSVNGVNMENCLYRR